MPGCSSAWPLIPEASVLFILPKAARMGFLPLNWKRKCTELKQIVGLSSKTTEPFDHVSQIVGQLGQK